MKSIFIFPVTFLFLFCTLPANSTVKDKIDSLEKKLVNAADSDKFDICYALVYYYQNIDMNKTFYYLEESLNWAKKTKNIDQEARATADFGKIYYFRSDYTRASKYYEEAIKLFKQVRNIKQAGQVYNELGNLYWTQTKYSEAVKFYLEELRLCEAGRDSAGIARALGSIAFIHEKSEEYDKALEIYFNALSMWTKLKNKNGQGVVLTNIGSIYKIKKQYDQSLDYYIRALKVKTDYSTRRFLDVPYFNIADLYLEMKKYDSAAANYRIALSICENFSNTYTGAYIHLGFGKLYKALNMPDSSISHLKAALEYALKARTSDAQILIYKELSDYYASKGNFSESYKFLNKYIEISDSLKPSEARQQIAAYELEKIQANLKVTQREKEIASLKSKKTKNQRNFLILFSVLFLLLAITIYNRFLIKKRTNKVLENVNQTKDKFFTIIAHDLKNQLTAFQNISQVLAEHFQDLTEEKKQQLINKIHSAAITLYSVLENLLTWSSAQLSGIGFIPSKINLKELAENTCNELKLTAEKKKIELKNEIPGEFTVFADENMVRDILRNLVNNSIKFSPENSEIVIGAEIKNEMAEISVLDQGIGISRTDQDKLFRMDINHKEIGIHKEKGSGLGLIISKDFVEKMNGRIWVESEEGKGSKFSFSLPLNA